MKFIWNHPLASKDRAGAIRRYFRWQFGARLLGYPVIAPFIGHSKLVVEKSMTGATGNLYCGLHEFGDMAFLLHFLRADDNFIDIGANVGSYTILASSVVGARTTACEPVPSTFAWLKRNIAVNEIEDLVDARQEAIGAARGVIRFSTDRDTTNQAVSDTYEGRSLQVPVIALDELERAKQSVLWKVDVEGYEEAVLQGAAESLRSCALHAVLLEGNTLAVQSAMRDAGFALATYDPFERAIAFEGNQEHRSSKSANNLWIRDAKFVTDRCRSAVKYELHKCIF